MKKIILLLLLGMATSSYGQWDDFTTSEIFTYDKVGIGLMDPTARLDVRLKNSFIGNDESGIRVTYPNVNVPVGSNDVNNSIFEVRRDISFGTFQNYKSDFIVKRGGYVGVATADPQARLDIRMPDRQEIIVQSEVPNTYSGFLFNHSDGSPNWKIRAYSNFTGGYNNILGIQSAGGAGELWIAAKKTMIGDFFDFDDCMDCDNYLLYVKKGIRTEKVRVDVASGTWADYVFEDDYDLKSLAEVEAYISENGHLPNVPSAEEVEESGINLGEMDALLLEKIEELTLHMISLQKENEEMKEILESIKRK
ncbi:MAG: hypothetical protein AAGA77_14130 [Bacteroidota bacterium]